MKHAYVIMLGILSYFLATDIYTSSMPEIALFFNETSDEVQKTMSYFLLGSVLTCILTSIFADCYGKKKFLMLGMMVGLPPWLAMHPLLPLLTLAVLGTPNYGLEKL